MMFNPSTMLPGRSAIELCSEDGRVVATLYALRSGIEIVCQQGHTAEFQVTLGEPMHLHVTIAPDTPIRR